MARPIKRGLSYFPLDVHVFKDPRIKKLERRFGAYGSIIFIRLLALVYEQGYYLETTIEDIVLELQEQVGTNRISYQRVLDVILMCCELDILNGSLFQQGVITSDGIQKQFLRIAKRRKEVDISKYWLLDSTTMDKIGVLLSMDKNESKTVNVNNNSVNVDINTQRKSKRESKKDKKINLDKSIYGAPKMHYLTKLIIERKYINEYSCDILKFNALFESVIETYGYDCVLSGVNYLISYAKNPTPPIDDKFKFMEVSLSNNLERFRKQGNSGGINFEKWIEEVFS